MPTGGCEVVDDKDWLLAHVGELSDQQEAPYAARWSTADAPADFLERQARGIVGLRLEITRLEGKMKMSQNRDMRDRDGVVRGLAERAQGARREVAAWWKPRCASDVIPEFASANIRDPLQPSTYCSGSRVIAARRPG